MNTKKIRSCYNLAITKSGNNYNIIRYVNGFDNEPVTILKNLDKNEVNSKFQRAINLIAGTMSDYGVFIKPMDKNQLVELVLVLEDSGISTSDIKIQNNGTVYFKMSGEDDTYVRNNIEGLLRENNFDYEHEMITVTRGDALNAPSEKKAELVEFKPISKTEDVYLQTDKEEVDTVKSKLSEKEQEELETLQMYPELRSNAELKDRYNYLIEKVGATVQPSPSMDESTIDPISTSDVKENLAEKFLLNIDKKFDSAQDLINSMLSNGVDIEQIKECYKNRPELFSNLL